jgi:hypothetical protein
MPPEQGGQSDSGQQGSDGSQGDSGGQQQQGQEDPDEVLLKDPKGALKTIKTLRGFEKESSDLKRQVAERDAELKKFKDAQLTDAERLQKLASENESKATAAMAELQQERLGRSIERVAAKMGFVDPEDAFRLIDGSDIDLDDAGRPKPASVEKAMKALAEKKPHLLARRPPPSVDGGGRTTSPAGETMNDHLRRMAGR